MAPLLTIAVNSNQPWLDPSNPEMYSYTEDSLAIPEMSLCHTEDNTQPFQQYFQWR